MEFSFELATEKDDAAIRQLLASSAMPGRLTITFEREPNYFWGCGTMGRFCQVILARHKPSGELAGMMCRGIRQHFVNGQPQELGYIGQIRIAPKYQGLWLLSRGLAFFRALHADGRTLAYYGAISDENRVARGILVEHPRHHFPVAYRVAHIHTLGLIVRRPQPPLPSACDVQRGSPETSGDIAAFLRHHGAAKQFFPVYADEDFGRDSPTTRGFAVQDFVVAYHQGQIVGVLGLWDQSSFKQTVVQAYSGWLRWVRPLYNLGARIWGARPLPAPGQRLHSAYASFICIANNDPIIFGVLLRHVYNQAAERGLAHLLLGLTEHDPLLPVAREYANITYRSQLFIGYWQNESSLYEQLDERIPYVEIATL